ncbi:MAG: winged helix-turn-helix domain-containing protein [Thermoanaerobaculia bacterium]|nr:winged helix-turn-helix domain-containing protein [Thermoanaerobaculia bacterium]
MEGERRRLGELIVDLRSGEIHHPEGRVTHLAPQPASLLSLLMENAGQVVERQRIRDHIWPGVAVDFESSLHYCVRQVRAALGDSASESRFVETLARRGYRLKVRPEAVKEATRPAGVLEGDEPSSVTGGDGIGFSPTISRMLVGVVGIFWLAVFGLALSSSPSVVPRLAILPFDPPEAWADATRTESVPELLLLRLGTDPASLVALGPTSTAGHGADGDDLHDLVRDLEVHWAINGRYIEAGNVLPGDGRGVLVELIRTRDGAHVWVEAYPLTAEPDVVAESVTAEVVSRLFP